MIPWRPSRIRVTRLSGTSSAFDNAPSDTPAASIYSPSISPGCTGLIPFFMSTFVLLSVVVRDLHVVRPVRAPPEANAPLRVDPDAELTFSVAPQRLEPVARQRRKITERPGTGQQGQAPNRLIGKPLKGRERCPSKNRLVLRSLKLRITSRTIPRRDRSLRPRHLCLDPSVVARAPAGRTRFQAMNRPRKRGKPRYGLAHHRDRRPGRGSIAADFSGQI